ncbi:bifunctional phosphoribosyl-AMP cyclohydrolase/phosphoribosyl-ATP diphosphatase [Pseudoxanthomonas broegbernensis]|uniref:Histidine biosynthesis bifunctional protein HisIE n=1 Tax=Pseudoxanthomonas broegbernensis TaxID=83619 RepID=A0A7V8GPH8_9GAMM|nr:bifunctional phosphoribosyl-AMP cyclohydrolase/phosphoribosyl-ATP diphosphatase HisIE [Pseudoxanthomonas broegbernensis]KAF1687614.1 bifunctional phosphoribosyl-AMP cyclohydrolase/phosphoribosyl-ATP diphosphatase [Pseudoxanthomonas broegbernensis]MBB6064636.1 phosphoribosyl-ATP pyrophosphohydrolase/phosphoribosyl-AMP cyclohydrolase [Pseudoxanthomonas broegbernensis]
MSSPSPIAGPLSTESLDWDKGEGLLPAIVQDADSLRVLMVGYMDRDALRATQNTGLVTFYSRSKQRLWTKGETSGHVLELAGVQADCDSDALLVLARPRGPTCHLQRASCFPAAPAIAGEAAPPAGDIGFLSELDALIARRARERPEGSYTTGLFEAGVRRIAQKVGEEGVETALAGVAQNDAQLLGESADLIYHLVVLLHSRGLSLADAVQVLAQRHRR